MGGRSIYDVDFEFLEGVDRKPEGVGLTCITTLPITFTVAA